MRLLRPLVVGSLAVMLSACGSTVVLLPPLDSGPNDANNADIPGTSDGTTGSDVTGSPDASPVADAVVTSDTVPADDAVTTTDGGVADDTVIVEDLPPPPTDAGPGTDVPIVTGDAAACPNGIGDHCPAAFPGACADLADGAMHTITFTGLGADIPASCEGAQTSMGPDGIVPLTITTPSDLVLTGTPTGGDAVVVALTPAAGCGMQAAEIRCANSSSGGSGGTATVRASSLAPGVYAVQVSSARGTPAIVQAMISPARPRTRGDVCPGVAITPDGMPVTLSTMGFATDADYGTSCGSNGAPGGWTDAVFSYTLTAARDVTIDVSATGTGNLSMSVESRCGDRTSAIGGCGAGNPAHRVLRNQAPGTYYVVVEYRGGARSMVATVSTATPTPPSPADACPGVALTANMVSTVDVAGLSGGTATFSCLPARAEDAVFRFTAPAAGDVLVNVAGSNNAQVAYVLQSPCGGAAIGGCTGPANSVWRRVQGLTAGQTYSIVAGTDGTMGTLAGEYIVAPAAPATVMVTGNEMCGTARAIPATGGIFRGNSSGAAQVFAPPCGSVTCGGGRAVYFSLALAARKRVIANTLGSGFDTMLTINSGDPCPGRPYMNACNDDTVGQASQVDVTLPAGNYWVVVQGCGFRVGGDYTLDVAVVDP